MADFRYDVTGVWNVARCDDALSRTLCLQAASKKWILNYVCNGDGENSFHVEQWNPFVIIVERRSGQLSARIVISQ